MLFESKINLRMKDADITYYPKFFSTVESDFLLEKLLKNTNWQQDTITVFGKTHLQPRLTAFYADNNKPYKYSNIIMQPHEFDGELLKIKNTIETELNIKFTSCLANLYRDGKDSNGWHADNEKELGKNPIIASVSFGTERAFHFKHRFNKNLKQKLTLEHGSLLLMKGKTQANWLHQIPKTKKEIEKRINLTFRIIA
tara:strand:+ start:1412 stop:2005 length:594 start_codon:yes stop_codon:yes gene_type:complete